MSDDESLSDTRWRPKESHQSGAALIPSPTPAPLSLSLSPPFSLLPVFPSAPLSPSDSCCVEVTVHLVEGPSLSSLPAVLWCCVNVRGFLIRLCTQTGPKAEAAPLCLKLAHSLSPFLLSLVMYCNPVPSLCFFFFFQHNKPLYSFEDNADYVYDVMWSPVHPAIFAAVDGMGRLDLWNLNNDTEVRVYERRSLRPWFPCPVFVC